MLPEPGDLEDLLEIRSPDFRPRSSRRACTEWRAKSLRVTRYAFRDFALRLEEGDRRLLDEEDESAQSSPFGLSGEELRAELQRALSEGEVDRLRGLPWGIGSVGRAAAQVPSGVFFACRTTGEQRYWRYVEAGTPMTVEREEAEILRRLRLSRTTVSGDPIVPIDLEEAWDAAAASIVDEHNLRAQP